MKLSILLIVVSHDNNDEIYTCYFLIIIRKFLNFNLILNQYFIFIEYDTKIRII